jgi:hypothetical protein
MDDQRAGGLGSGRFSMAPDRGLHPAGRQLGFSWKLVARRAHDRRCIALGAGNFRWLVVWQGLKLTLVGTAIGPAHGFSVDATDKVSALWKKQATRQPLYWLLSCPRQFRWQRVRSETYERRGWSECGPASRVSQTCAFGRGHDPGYGIFPEGAW